jgi:AcrR family transcriptional regulator
MAVPARQSPTRQERRHEATKQEIIATARRLLVEQGPTALTLRAIAREMEMSPTALYRYFGDGIDELVQNVIADIFTEFGADVQRAVDQADGDDDIAKLTAKVIAACREFREWALAHHGEFALLFGVPLPGIDDGRYDIASECAMEFAGAYFGLFLELWTKAPFPVPAPDEIDQGLRDQLTRYREFLGIDIPLGAVLIFLRCWTLLYGAVAMEVFGHVAFALVDPAPMFEYTLADLAELVGLPYPPQR